MPKRWMAAGWAAAVLSCNGCAPSPLSDEAWDDLPDRRLAPRIQQRYGSADNAADPAAAADVDEPLGDVTLAEAIAAAVARNPELTALGWQAEAAAARMIQAGLWPNPEIEVEVEEFARSNAGEVDDATETALVLGQPIPTAGKVAKRRRVAELERELAGWDHAAGRLDVAAEASRRFGDVLAAQSRVDVARKTFQLAEQVHRVISQQVEAGEVSIVEQTRAAVELSNARIELRRAERSLAAARRALAATWGAAVPRFERAVGELTDVTPPPPLSELETLAEDNPDLARWNTVLARHRVEVDLARARAWPDPTLGAGIQHFNEGDDTAAILLVSLPLPLFDRNQGAILAARYALAAARADYEAVRVRIRSELGRAYEQLEAARVELLTLQEETLPSARSAYEAIRRSYEEGRTDVLNVLDAQRTLFATERRLVEAAAEHRRIIAELERFVARPLMLTNGGPAETDPPDRPEGDEP